VALWPFVYCRVTTLLQYQSHSDVNKDLTLKAKAKAKDSTFKAKAKDSAFKAKAKAKAKDRTFEGLNRELDI